MRYYIDTEFIERPHTIKLISIGIVAEDGRSLYLINKDFPFFEAWDNNWIRDNVVIPIGRELRFKEVVIGGEPNTEKHRRYTYAVNNEMSAVMAESLIMRYGLHHKELRSEIIDFIGDDREPCSMGTTVIMTGLCYAGYLAR